MSSDWQRVRELFESMCDLGQAERSAKLSEAAKEDPALRADVESLLTSYDEGATALDRLAAPDMSEMPRPGAAAERIGQQIGSYLLLEQLAVGGMSTVYLAQRTDGKPHDRVAIKIITTAGPLSQRARKRFDQERQLLAKLDHPNIAKLLHGGVTEDGWPYLVMEYVDGKQLDTYCEQHNLSIDARIEVFCGVCSAIQYAHQNLVVHRDLKPSNILVNRDGVPKLLDFGVAKLLGSDDEPQNATVPTTERFLTPEYASPEQLRGAGVTAASDVYSLGVVLYQLLTGRRPHNFKTRLFYEVARIICDDDPPRPSVAVLQTTEPSMEGNSSGQASLSPSKTARARTRRSKISHQLAGDMDAIVMKAMRKEPGSRYSSVDQLADDLGRYLQAMPVRARKGTWRYRASKFVRRNRTSIAAVTAIFVTLIAGVVVSTRFAIQARQEARAATEARDEAKRQTAIAEAVNDFFNDDFLAAVAPDRQGKDVTMRQVLDGASKTLSGKFGNAPLIEASIRTTVGRLYRSLGEYEAAEPHLKRALTLRLGELGEGHPDTPASMSHLAQLYTLQGRLDEAESLHTKALELDLAVWGEDDPHTLGSMDDLAELYTNQGRYDEAEPLFAKAIEGFSRALGEDHPDTLLPMTNLATLYLYRGWYDKAEPLYVRSLQAKRRQLGEDHPDTLGSMNNLASLYRLQGRYDKAERLYARAFDGARRILGEDHPHTLTFMSNLAVILEQQRRYAEAEPLCVKALDAKLRILGEDHLDTLISRNNLAQLYSNQGRYEEAEPLSVMAVEGARRLLGEEHPHTLTFTNNLARLYTNQSRFDKAGPLCVKALAGCRRALGEDHPATLVAKSNFAAILGRKGERKKAEQMLRRVLDLQQTKLAPDDLNVLTTRDNLAALLQSENRFTEAESLYRANLAALERGGWGDTTRAQVTRQNLASLARASDE